MAQPALVPDESRNTAKHDDIVILRGATWADYQRILEIRGDRAVPRLRYLEGVLELMTPSRMHERIKSIAGRLVEAWCFVRGVEITPYGSWTLENKVVDRGVEPDECYVVGDDPEPERPDLAIEVIWTSGGLDKLELYRKLGVREVWIWMRDRFETHALRGERYESMAGSEVLPGIDLEELARYVGITPMSRAVREYRAALEARRSSDGQP
jgi:Uma2 family endonuclease